MSVLAVVTVTTKGSNCCEELVQVYPELVSPFMRPCLPSNLMKSFNYYLDSIFEVSAMNTESDEN